VVTVVSQSNHRNIWIARIKKTKQSFEQWFCVGMKYWHFPEKTQVRLLRQKELSENIWQSALHWDLENTVQWGIWQTTHRKWGDRGSTVVKAMCYKSEGRWFDPRRCVRLSLYRISYVGLNILAFTFTFIHNSQVCRQNTDQCVQKCPYMFLQNDLLSCHVLLNNVLVY